MPLLQCVCMCVSVGGIFSLELVNFVPYLYGKPFFCLQIKTLMIIELQIQTAGATGLCYVKLI